MAIHLPKTTSRGTQSTGRRVNERIQTQIKADVERFRGADRETLSRRLEELDREWDLDRTIEARVGVAVLLGIALGARVDRRWFAWSALAATFLLVHSLFGWFPALPILRRFGVRTQAEIEEERDALRILRGDFKATQDPLEALAQARLSLGPEIVGASLSDSK